MMELFPAIDLKGGQVVRLTQGDYDRVDVYSDDPVEVALAFKKRGARNLHVVDLDGAKDGKLVNFEVIRRIMEQSGLCIQVGGGIRDEQRIAQYLDVGVARVILGTIAVENFDFMARMVKKYGKRIAVGVDARDGKVAVKGWLETTPLDAMKFCARLDKAGVVTIIYTDISKDGAMAGTNLDVYDRLSYHVGCEIVASGGISSKEEVFILRDMGMYGVILGKALYTGAILLEDIKEVSDWC